MPTARAGFEDSPTLSGRVALAQNGAILTVQIGFDPRFLAGSRSRPTLPDRQLRALVDTGAVSMCIDSALATELGLTTVDRVTIAGVHGANRVNLYLAQVYVPSLHITIHGSLPGGHLAAGGLPFSALIGRDFLQHFTMIYEGRTGAVLHQ